MSQAPAEKKRPKNWLLIKIREWHTWMGIALSVVIVMVCITGIYLNHKDFFRGGEKEPGMAKEGKPAKDAAQADVATLGTAVETALATAREKHGTLEVERVEVRAQGGRWIAVAKPMELAWDAAEPSFVAVHATDHEHAHEEKAGFTLASLASSKVTPAQAVRLGLEKLGENPAIEKVEIKHEHGHLQYKLKTHGYGEVTVLASGDEPMVLGKYEEPAKSSVAGGATKGGYNWGKIMKDLHTGKLGGEAGKLLIDFTSFVIIVLTISGVYLWYVPRKRKKEAAAQAKAAIEAKAAKPAAVAVQA